MKLIEKGNMTNLEKYNQVFCTTLELKEDKLVGLQYQGTELWDSVGHMSLVANLEEAFDIMMEMDDIVDLSSYEKGKEILKKYDVEI
jgi:acyl carrier protein